MSIALVLRRSVHVDHYVISPLTMTQRPGITMNHLSRTLLLALTASFMALGLTACKQGYDTPCVFPDASQIQRTCVESAGDKGVGGTCVYRQAPDCDTGVCAVHLDSSGFCTKACEEDADCPDKSICMNILNGQSDVCVPEKYLK